MNTVGVVIATYNGERYIAEQLLSIINQTVKPDIIVVSDGASADGTVRICKEILGTSGINHNVLINTERLSVRENFERALMVCEADYILFSDQDDVWQRDKVEVVLKVMKNRNAVLVFTNAFIVDSELNLNNNETLWDSIGYYQKEKEKLYPIKESFLLSILLKRNIVTGMCCCITNELAKAVLPLSTNTIHDVWIALVATQKGSVVGVDEKLLLYRQHDKNVIGVKSGIKKAFANRKQYYKKLNNRLKLMYDLLGYIHVNKCGVDSIDMIIDYTTYLESRIDFIRKKKSIFFPMYIRKKYMKYEVKACQIILKDLFVRVLRSGV